MFDLRKIKVGRKFKKDFPFRKDYVMYSKGGYNQGYGISLEIFYSIYSNSKKANVYDIQATLYDVSYIRGEEESEFRDSVNKIVKTTDISVLKHYVQKVIDEIEKL